MDAQAKPWTHTRRPKVVSEVVTEISEDRLAELSEFSLLSENAEQAGVPGPLPEVERVESGAAEGRISALRWGAPSLERPPRVVFLNLSDVNAVAHNEEHLVIETAEADAFKVGDCLYGIPWHICPTVALHSEAVVVENDRATQHWKIVGRERKLTI